MYKITAPLSPGKVDALILRVTALCWLMAKLIGWRMFTTYRLLPTAPVFNLFDGVPNSCHTFLFVFAVLLMILVLANPLNKFFLISLFSVEILSCLLDQNRVQPWDYQYLFILFIFSLYDRKNDKPAAGIFLFVMVSIYAYGGISKLNTGFLHSIWTKMLLEQFLHVSPKAALQTWMQYCGYFAGICELAGGIGLLFGKTRKVAAVMLMVMHLFILVFLGPLGLRYNLVVWPWNVAMMGYLYLTCFKHAPVALTMESFGGRYLPVFICWGILPALNFFGWWDNYLSSNIYSGKLPEMIICVKDTSKCRPLQRYCVKGHGNFCDGEALINLQYWSMTETKMAPYPEIRSYQKIQAKLEEEYPGAGFSFIYFEDGKRIEN